MTTTNRSSPQTSRRTVSLAKLDLAICSLGNQCQTRVTRYVMYCGGHVIGGGRKQSELGT